MSVTTKVGKAVPLSIYNLLRGEHEEVKGMFKLLELSPEVMDESREAVFEKLRKELLSHSIAEQEAVYSRVREKISDKEVVQEADREHTEIELMLDAVEDAGVDSEDWKEKLKLLELNVDHHVEEEEGKMFEEMKDVFTDDEAKDMAKNFQQVKERELESMN